MFSQKLATLAGRHILWSKTLSHWQEIRGSPITGGNNSRYEPGKCVLPCQTHFCSGSQDYLSARYPPYSLFWGRYAQKSALFVDFYYYCIYGLTLFFPLSQNRQPQTSLIDVYIVIEVIFNLFQFVKYSHQERDLTNC